MSGSRERGRGRRLPVPVMLAMVVVLFSAILVVSRLVDLGIFEGKGFVSDVDRKRTEAEVDVRRARGGLSIEYGPTRYPYLWVVALSKDRKVSPILPPVITSTAPYGHRAENLGERVFATPKLEPPYVVLSILSPVPRRIEELQRFIDETEESDPRAAALAMQLPGKRFVKSIAAEP